MTSPQDETPRERLARLMDERRGDLGLYWHEVASDAGMTREGLRKIREGASGMRTGTRMNLERALRWERGSINDILAGGEPTPLAAAPPKPGRQQTDLSGLTVGELAERVEELLEKKAERRREDEILDQEVARLLEQLRNREGQNGQRAG